MPESVPAVFPAKRCSACGELFGHPPAVCSACGSEAFGTDELSGEGRLYASTVIRVPGSDHQGQEPFVVGLVDVGADERVRVTARIESTDGTGRHLAPDTPVEFVGRRDDTFVFRPA